MPTRAEVLRDIKSRDSVYKEDFAAILDFVGQKGEGALVYGSTFQSIPTGVPTDVTDWNTEVYDDLDFWSAGAPGLFTIPNVTPAIERVQVYFQYTWQPNATGLRNFFLEQNGGGNVRGGIIENGLFPSAAAPLGTTSYSMPFEVSAGDTLGLVVNQDSGISLALTLLGFGITVAK